MRSDKAQKVGASLLKRAAAWLAGDRGNVTPIIAFMLIPIIGAFAIATETSTWFLVQRSEQSAADSAVLAAAANGTNLSTDTPAGTADYEAKAVATQYGYTTGGNTTVTVTRPSCPSPWTGTCYKVRIDRNLPIRLAAVLGFAGDVAVGSAHYKTVSSEAIGRAGSKGTYCITAFGTADDAISFKGAPFLDLTGCDIASAGGGSCNGTSGNTVGHAYVTTAGDGKNCGPNEVVGAAPADIYASLKTNIPAQTCSAGPPTQISGPISSNQKLCNGGLLTGNVTVNSDVIFYVVNGDLNVSNFSLSTTSTGHLTVIFTGDVGTSYSHTFTGSGSFDFAAPTTGVWSGIAFYTDPRLTVGSYAMSDVGNSPTYNVTGLLYMPFSDIVIKGAINHKTGGDNCMSMVVKTLDIRGTGSIFSTPSSECDRAGLTLQGPAGSSRTPLLVQ